MRCQARLDFTDETRFRSCGKRNAKQQKMNTTMCNRKSNPISDLAGSGLYRNDF